MKYRPGLPEHNDNISPTHPLKELATLLGGLLLIGVLTYLLLGMLIDVSVDRISPETEQAWFRKPGLNQAIEASLGKAVLVAHDKRPLFDALKACAGIDIELRLWRVDSATVNAFAVPGGDIIVFSGLEKMLKSQNGLAFVLAHELAHFKHRDHLRGLGRGIVLTFMSGLVAGNDGALTRLVSPVSVLGQRAYSRSRERAADALALDILHCHYGHVSGAEEFFALISHEQEARTYQGSQYFSTHPASQERVAALQARVQERGYAKQPTIPLDNHDE